MDIARTSIDRPLYTWLIMLIALLGGIWGFMSLGRLEDPAFTIKEVVVFTPYPGASAEQVALEVSEPLESAIQKMEEVKEITSTNRPGMSRIGVEFKDTYAGDELPQIWTSLRAEVRDAARALPEGAGQPQVNDRFGDVYGIFYAVTTPGFSDAEIYELSTYLRRELLTVDGVADVEIAGIRDEAIYVEPRMSIATNLGISSQAIANAISTSNSVTPAGDFEPGDAKIRITTPEGSDSVSEIAGLTVGSQGETIKITDIAHVWRGRTDDPSLLIRHNGTEAFTIGISGIADENIVDVGNRVDAKLAALDSVLPYGVELQPIYQQHVVVDESSNAFLVNLAMSVSIVVVVLALFMGWRAAVVVGTTLLLTVVGTLLFMALFSIEMERISLGALIIAMGMLVDNAIVVAEGMQIAMHRGKTSREAATEASAKSQIPLLGATVIGIMAFAGIGLSPDSTGEFLFSLFAVIAMSLLLSWVLALTATPLLGHYFFKQGSGDADDAYGSLLFRAYANILRAALRLRWLVVAALVGVTALSFVGFGQLRQQFFPDSNTPIFFLHYKLPQGTSIETTSRHLETFENWLQTREEVVDVSAFAGRGATRFLLTYGAQQGNPSYGHLIIRTRTLADIPALRADFDAFGKAAYPEGEFRTERLVFGPGGGAQIEVRFSGPDPKVLRALADQAMTELAASSDKLRNLRHDWREQELVLKPIYATDRAQTAGVTREDIAGAFTFGTTGVTTGQFRERERQIPIVLRQAPEEPDNLMNQVVFSSAAGDWVPVEQMLDGLSYEVENTQVQRRNRVYTLTVGADITPDVTAATVWNAVHKNVEAIELPPGYLMEWGGEHENSSDANASLGKQLPLSLLVMVLISVVLFNALRQPIIIWLLVPMSVNGVVLALMGTGLPFTFTALLGLLSLSGMLIKNGIVLVEEIDIQRGESTDDLRDAIVTASVSRLRPVMLAALTTILGMAPLISDAFFVSMAATIMGGLAFATILTMIAAPVFYMIFFAREDRRQRAAAQAA
ncbi:AcrB/AcrD/AcrF family protein [Epibacterium sp. SM1969]|uniref:AcrB/AcrD/AcrF family protein n=1 Tax=Tritonibacter aquimaris TaxID=2663379 RepID=A0A844B0V1_9RHOB|nr:efflux RND transporter permease subunit [Tritonibacter aquimaris]MQY43932.1 AcrB/AcrD/AcrF family protein [Tritonibacter aquimaris]